MNKDNTSVVLEYIDKLSKTEKNSIIRMHFDCFKEDFKFGFSQIMQSFYNQYNCGKKFSEKQMNVALKIILRAEIKDLLNSESFLMYNIPERQGVSTTGNILQEKPTVRAGYMGGTQDVIDIKFLTDNNTILSFCLSNTAAHRGLRKARNVRGTFKCINADGEIVINRVIIS